MAQRSVCSFSLMSQFLFGAMIGLILSLSSWAQEPLTVRESFDLQVPLPPTAVNIGGKVQLVYELHLTNFTHDELALTRVTVSSVKEAEHPSFTVGDFRETELIALLGHPGRDSQTLDKRVVGPGMHAVVYLWLSLESGGALPEALKHRIEFEVIRSNGREHAAVEGGIVNVRPGPTVILGPPLRGGPWVAIYGPSWERGHRRVIVTANGRARIPARLAIDWVKLDNHGKLAPPDDSKVENSYSYGAEVVAVKDSIVAAVRDGVDERSSSTESNQPNKLEDGSGNFIALDLGPGLYAFYEHLKPNSIKVKAGERVARGQAIAQLGNTGDTTGPHLHFHLADANSPLAAEGIPYVFENFELLGTYDTIETFGRGTPWSPRLGEVKKTRELEFPAALSVVQFPEE